MEKIGIERISNGYIVYGVEFKTYRERLAEAEKEFDVERQNVVAAIREQERDERKTINPAKP